MARNKIKFDYSDEEVDKITEKIKSTDSYKDYLESGCWKCSKSPSNAHYWIEEKIGFDYPITYFKETCKYCKVTKIVCSTTK